MCNDISHPGTIISEDGVSLFFIVLCAKVVVKYYWKGGELVEWSVDDDDAVAPNDKGQLAQATSLTSSDNDGGVCKGGG